MNTTWSHGTTVYRRSCPECGRFVKADGGSRPTAFCKVHGPVEMLLLVSAGPRQGLSYERYDEIDAVRWSELKHMADSPAHYKHHIGSETTDTPRLAVGRGTHTAILEPERFASEYAVFDGPRRAGKVWEEFAEANADKTILRRDEYDECLAMRDAVHAHETASSLLYGHSEVVVEWTDPGTGIRCKARLDHVNADGEFCDVKTTSSTGVFDFQRLSARMLYHCQLAFHRQGLAAVLGGPVPRPRIIAIEQNPPHDVVVYRLTDDAMYAGDQHVGDLLRRLATCRERDEWPGRHSCEQDLTVPPWMLSDDGEVGYGMTIGGERL